MDLLIAKVVSTVLPTRTRGSTVSLKSVASTSVKTAGMVLKSL